MIAHCDKLPAWLQHTEYLSAQRWQILRVVQHLAGNDQIE